MRSGHAGGTVEVWTDGGCIGNPGPGAWAYVIRSGSSHVARSGFEPATTNNRMELRAVIEALKELSRQAEARSHEHVIATDSQYVQKGITEWIHSWVRNGWRTTSKKPVKNSDLWRELLELSSPLRLHWRWVAGHAGNPMNEECHRMVEAEVSREGKQQG